MLRLLLASVVLCAFHSASAEHSVDDLVAVFGKCKDETGASEDIADIISKHIFPSSQKGKCLLLCVLEAHKMVKGDSLDVDSTREYIKQTYAEDEVKREAALKALDACKALFTDTQGHDISRCQKAYDVFTCAFENHIRLS